MEIIGRPLLIIQFHRGEPGKVDLYTMDGVQLMSSPLSFGTAILDISILSQGVYLVKTTNEAGLSHVSQFIVKK